MALPWRTSPGPSRPSSRHARPLPERSRRGPWRAPGRAASSVDALREDDVGGARLSPDRRELLVGVAVEPATRVLDRRELNDDCPLRVPGALDALGRAATDDEPALERLQRGDGARAVVRVAFLVADVDARDRVAPRHRAPPPVPRTSRRSACA